MPWVAIADSGIAFEFWPNAGATATMDGSTVQETGHANSQWFIIFEGPVRARITVQAYSASEEPTTPANVWGGASDPIPNSNGLDAFEPSPVEVEVTQADFDSNFDSIGFNSSVLTEGEVIETYTMLVEVWVEPEPEVTSYNCQCDDDYPRSTLADMRKRLARRLGFSVQVSMGALPPGMAELLDDFIVNAQELLYRRYSVFRMERFFTWDLEPGVRFYDLDANADTCTRRLDPRKVTWVGISQGDLSWRPLVCGIDPVMYGSPGPGIPSHYEIRQCIEVWPPPADATWKLRVKGHFGLGPLVEDTDETSIDPEAIFLLALANAKEHYNQADGRNYATQATNYVRGLVAGSHHTRRYVPGECTPPPAVRPRLVGSD